jgi:hypothetical protein
MPGINPGMLERYQEAVEAQQEVMRGLLGN